MRFFGLYMTKLNVTETNECKNQLIFLRQRHSLRVLCFEIADYLVLEGQTTLAVILGNHYLQLSMRRIDLIRQKDVDVIKHLQ